MRLLLSYPSEYDQGEGVHYANVFRRLGHEVCELNTAAKPGCRDTGRVIRGYPAAITLNELITDVGLHDLYLYVEPLGLIPRGLETAPFPTACIISDVHRNLKARLRLAQLFDYVFLYQRNYVAAFVDHDKDAVQWLPYACDTEVLYDLDLNRDIDVAFIGKATSTRRRIVERLAEKYRMNEQRYYRQSEISQVYSRAKLVVNMPIGSDLNFRVFEALSCGSLLLTERLKNGQEELFKEDVHYAAYGSHDELFAKVQFFLRNDALRRRIATAGKDEVRRFHRLDQRAQELLKKVCSATVARAPVRRMNAAQVVELYSAVYERSGRIEALLDLAAEQRHDRSLYCRIIYSVLRSIGRRLLFDR